jgi:GNAT superfamily N-acetyltransferase
VVEHTLDATLETHPLTAERWDDLAALFGRSGACYGCWCMFWRLTSTEFNTTKARQHEEAFRSLVEGGSVPGLLAYVDGQPAGWCSIAPRGTYARLVHSRSLQPIDERLVWSIVCFFIGRKYRGQGIAGALLKAAVRYAAEQGAPAVEAYPPDTAHARVADMSAYMGTLDMFLDSGFQVVRRVEGRGNARPRCIVRYDL